MNLSRTAQRALKALMEHGGEGAIAKDGTLIAAGVVLGEHASRDEAGDVYEAYSRQTWARLVKAGFVEHAGPRRLKLKIARVAV